MNYTLCAGVFLVLSIFYLVNSGAIRPPRCREHEEWTCKNISCVSTCQNPNRNGVCDGCTPGCYCVEDYWRNEETGQCVEMSQCPCENGRVFRWGNPCQDSCCSEICPQYVVAGCYCPQGQCNLKGVCIPDPRLK